MSLLPGEITKPSLSAPTRIRPLDQVFADRLGRLAVLTRLPTGRSSLEKAQGLRMRAPLPAAGIIPTCRSSLRLDACVRRAGRPSNSPARRSLVWSCSVRSRAAAPIAANSGITRSRAAKASSQPSATRSSRPGSKKSASPSQRSVSTGAPQAAASKNRPEGHPAVSGHVGAGDVQRQAQGGEEGGMQPRPGECRTNQMFSVQGNACG